MLRSQAAQSGTRSWQCGRSEAYVWLHRGPNEGLQAGLGRGLLTFNAVAPELSSTALAARARHLHHVCLDEGSRGLFVTFLLAQTSEPFRNQRNLPESGGVSNSASSSG